MVKTMPQVSFLAEMVKTYAFLAEIVWRPYPKMNKCEMGMSHDDIVTAVH